MAKKIIEAICLFGIGIGATAILFGCWFIGCCSNKQSTDPTVLEYQRQVDRLEEELRARDRAIGNAVRELSIITERSRGMEGTIDNIILELDAYQRAVERLLHDYYCSGTETEAEEQSDNSAANHLIN